MRTRKAAPGWRAAGIALVAATTTFTTIVRAHGEPRTDVEVSLLGGYGFGGTFRDSTLNRYQAAIGVRAGVTLKAPRLHLGGSFIHFFGGEGDLGRAYTDTTDFEVGYDFELVEGLVLRPELGLGVAQPILIQSDNLGGPLVFHAAPGLLVLGRFRPLILSAEFREDLMLDGPSASTVLGGVGITF